MTLPSLARLRHFRLLPLSLAALLAPRCGKSRPAAGGRTYYLDCSAAAPGDGSIARPWNVLAAANSFHFDPGDQLLLKRGTTCRGMLHPPGSGTPSAPIEISAYGEGPRPTVDGGDQPAAIELFNQSGWELRHLRISAGERYGVLVSGDTPHSCLTHIDLEDLDVFGAQFTAKRRADSGEVYLSPKASGEALDDVRIDRVVAHNSRVSEGILVNAGGAFQGSQQTLGSNIVVENSTAHDVYGDGIVVTEAEHVLIQNNVVYNTGLCPANCGSTPNGLWEWYCHDCVIQGNESYANHSWSAQDGGDFDIDYYNVHNTVQYNYGHDSEGYCIAFFGAGGVPTTGSIFRYNICSNNGRKAANAYQGDVYVSTWNGGSIDGMEIYNNTFYWNPATDAAVFRTSNARFSGSLPRFFKNNLVVSTARLFVAAASGVEFDHNLYWSTASSPRWRYGGVTYPSFNAYRRGTQQDRESLFADPRVRDATYHRSGPPGAAFRLLPGSPARSVGVDVCKGVSECSMGARDFWGHPLAAAAGVDIGADQAP